MFSRAALAAVALAAASVAAQAAGALVVGNCGAYGYSHNYEDLAEARQRAMNECIKHKGKNCKQVVTLDGNCAAFATDTRRSCGAWGWATRANREDAEEVAIRECSAAGGRACRVRIQFCDTISTASPAMTTNWKSTDTDKQECLKRGEKVMKDAGLTKNFEVTTASVFGEQGDYTAQINCITDKQIVMFLIVGPKLEEARKHMSAIYQNF
jgi:hypothetical protein